MVKIGPCHPSLLVLFTTFCPFVFSLLSVILDIDNMVSVKSSE